MMIFSVYLLQRPIVVYWVIAFTPSTKKKKSFKDTLPPSFLNQKYTMALSSHIYSLINLALILQSPDKDVSSKVTNNLRTAKSNYLNISAVTGTVGRSSFYILFSLDFEISLLLFWHSWKDCLFPLILSYRDLFPRALPGAGELCKVTYSCQFYWDGSQTNSGFVPSLLRSGLVFPSSCWSSHWKHTHPHRSASHSTSFSSHLLSTAPPCSKLHRVTDLTSPLALFLSLSYVCSNAKSGLLVSVMFLPLIPPSLFPLQLHLFSTWVPQSWSLEQLPWRILLI